MADVTRALIDAKSEHALRFFFWNDDGRLGDFVGQ